MIESMIAMPNATSFLPSDTAPVVEDGWRDFAEHFPAELQQALRAEFGVRRRLDIGHIMVLSAKTRRPQNVNGEAGAAGPAACVEEFRFGISPWVSGKAEYRIYIYRRGLVEYNGNRTGGWRFEREAEVGNRGGTR